MWRGSTGISLLFGLLSTILPTTLLLLRGDWFLLTFYVVLIPEFYKSVSMFRIGFLAEIRPTNPGGLLEIDLFLRVGLSVEFIISEVFASEWTKLCSIWTEDPWTLAEEFYWATFY